MWLAEPGGASLTLGDKVQRKGGQWRGEVWQERRGDRFKKERKERAREIGRGGREKSSGERRDGDEQERGAKRKDEEKV